MIPMLKYVLGAFISIPLLPIMYVQGKRIRATIPELPEAASPEGTIKKASEKTFNLISLGESTIAGIGASTHEEAFTGTLAKAISQDLNCSVKWKVYAKSGFTAKDVRAQQIPKISEKHLDLIVVGLGGNDAFCLNHPIRWRNTMRGLIYDLQAKFPQTPIAFVNMPPIKEFPAFTAPIKFVIGNLVSLFGDELETLVASQDNVHYYARKITFDSWIKRLNLTDYQPSDFFSDGVHPSQLAYQIWAKDFWNYLSENTPLSHDKKQ